MTWLSELLSILSDIRDALQGIRAELERIAPHYEQQHLRSQRSDYLNQIHDLVRNSRR